MFNYGKSGGLRELSYVSGTIYDTYTFKMQDIID